MRGETTTAIVWWQSLGLTIGFGLLALTMWQPVTSQMLYVGIAIGVLLWLGQIWNVAAYRHGKASAIQTAEATRLIIALLIDLAVFAIVPDLGAILGIMLIAVAVGWHDCRTVLWRVIRGGHDSLKAKLNRKDATASIANIADDSGRFG